MPGLKCKVCVLEDEKAPPGHTNRKSRDWQNGLGLFRALPFPIIIVDTCYNPICEDRHGLAPHQP